MLVDNLLILNVVKSRHKLIKVLFVYATIVSGYFSGFYVGELFLHRLNIYGKVVLISLLFYYIC